MFNIKDGEVNEKDEDVIARCLDYLESSKVHKFKNIHCKK